MNGFIKLHRQLLNWEWYSDINVRVLFLHCLLKANHKQEQWQGITINVGEFVTSVEHLAKETGLSIQQTRTAINKLKITGEITNKTTSRYSIITVNNWDKWQANNIPNNKQITNNQHANQQTNNNKQEYKEIKNKEEEEEEESAHEKNSECEPSEMLKGWFGEFRNVHLTDSQYNKLLGKVLDKSFLNGLIDDLSANIAQKKDGAPVYDEAYPHMHYVILEKYWRYRKLNPTKFKQTAASNPNEADTAKILEEIRRERENWT